MIDKEILIAKERLDFVKKQKLIMSALDSLKPLLQERFNEFINEVKEIKQTNITQERKSEKISSEIEKLQEFVKKKDSELESELKKLYSELETSLLNNPKLKGENGKDGVDGRDGKDGVDGKDGKDGKNGRDGKDGITTIKTITDIKLVTQVEEKVKDISNELNELNNKVFKEVEQYVNKEIKKLKKLIPENLAIINRGSDATNKMDIDGINSNISHINFNTSHTINGEPVGSMFWNTVDGTIDIKLATDVVLQTGQEMHYYAKATESILNGDLLQFAGVQGDHILVKKCVPAEVIANPRLLIGIATHHIPNNNFGYVTAFGKLNDVYTTGWSAGDILYFDNATGQLTNVAPTTGQLQITVAVVIKEATGGAENGVLLTRITWDGIVGGGGSVVETGYSNNFLLMGS